MPKRLSPLRVLGSLFFILMVSSLVFVWTEKSNASSIIREANIDYDGLVDAVNVTALEEHVKHLSKDIFLDYGIQPTRAVGYPGNNLTAEYIHSFFVNNGLTNVSYQEFPIVECIDYGANITIKGLETITLYPLLPNLVCPSTTPPEGISGQIVYVGSGRIEELDGNPLDGSIVLMDWNSRNRWINAAKFGAKAVIFLPPPEHLLEMNHLMSMEGYMHEKYLPNVPFNFPRFYVNGTDADILLNHQSEEARIVSTQRWKKVTTRNVIGYVEGENPDVIVVVSSYYDSYSIAPSFAPGAQEATGLAGLLEIAKYMEKPENKPRNTVLFVAFSGHSRQCLGSYVFYRDYRSWHAVGGPYESIGDKMVYNINLDFSTGTNTTFLTTFEGATHTVGSGSQAPFYKPPSVYYGGAKIVQGIVEGLLNMKPQGKMFEVALDSNLAGLAFVRGWYGQYQSWKDMPYDHAWALNSYTGAFTVTAAYDARPFYWSPFDTLERVNFENLETLTQVANVLVNSFVNEDSEKLENAFIVPADRKEHIETHFENAQWMDSTCLVGRWAMEKAWYEEVPNAIFCALSIGTESDDMSYAHTMVKKFIFSDEEGRIWEDPESPLGERGFYYSPGCSPNFISAWIINETTGNVVMAPDYGEHMYENPLALSVGVRGQGIGFVVIFNSSTMVIFDSIEGGVNLLYDFKEHTSLREFGYWTESGVTVLAVPPETNFEYISKMAYDRYPRYFLINASDENPLGTGYSLEAGEQFTVHVPALRVAESFYHVNEEHFNTLMIANPEVRESEEYRLHLECWSLIQEAEASLKDYQYSRAESSSFQALYLSKNVYDRLRYNIEDAAYNVPYLAFFFVPFVFLAERLLFSWKGVKKALSIILTFAFLIFSFSFLHPGFVLASSPYIIVLGISILILSLPLVAIVAFYFRDHIRALRYARMGKHEMGGTAFMGLDNAFLTGIEHMRRYKLRSAFNFAAIILLLAGLVSFTSISTLQSVAARPVSGAVPSYQGLYIHKERWGSWMYKEDRIYTLTGWEIPDNFVITIQERFGEEATVVPRAWRYNLFKTFEPPPSRKVGFRITYGDKSLRIKALWGVTPQDFEVKAYLIAGRWFLQTDRGVAILGEKQAETLLGVNATSFNPSEEYIINLDGMRYKVIGIVDMTLEMAVSLDGEKITPLKMDWPPGIRPSYFMHLHLEDFIILPYEEVVELGGSTASLSIETENTTLIEQISSWMVNYVPAVPFHFLTFFSVTGQVSAVGPGYIVTTFGLENQLVPMALVFLSVLNIMVGSVYERRKSIATYSTIGLNPFQISFMFLAESIVYALLGGVIGYLVAMVMARTAAVLVPGMITLNYASGWVMIAVGSALLVTVSSSLFPAYLSSRLVTPSLERVWKLTTKPVGDKWEIPLPFRFRTGSEVEGFIRFFQEYNRAHAAADSPDFQATDVQITEGETEGKPYKCISAHIRLFPYDMNVEQVSSFYIIRQDKELWESRLIIHRRAGLIHLWTRHNHAYVSKIRDQLLLWGSLKDEEKTRYMKKPKA